MKGWPYLPSGCEKAFSANSPTIPFLVIQPKSPPFLALSSEYSLATSAKEAPLFNFSRASMIFECFSHKMCLHFALFPVLFCFTFFSSSF
uniref:Uncharacterized protein n=1 Tax=Arcella intermedia TaxID=1963864 RepID=A0A6B2LRV8_9EUKA